MSSMAAALAALAVTESRGCVASRASAAPAVAPSRTREILRISTPFISGAAQAGTDGGFLKARGPHRPSARGGAFRFGAGSRELRPEPAELGRGHPVPRACDDSQPRCPRSSVVASLDPRKRNGFATQFVAAWSTSSGGQRLFVFRIVMTDIAANPPLPRVDRTGGFFRIKKWPRRGGAKARRARRLSPPLRVTCLARLSITPWPVPPPRFSSAWFPASGTGPTPSISQGRRSGRSAHKRHYRSPYTPPW